jgi:hypothetical protein
MADALLDGDTRPLNPIGRVPGDLSGLVMVATPLFVGGVALGRCLGYTRPARTGLAKAFWDAVLIAGVRALGS